MNDHPVRGKIIREITARAETEIRFKPRVLPYHGGQFYSAYVVTLAVVGAALADKHLVAVLQSV